MPTKIKELYDSGEFTGKALEIAILHRPAGAEGQAPGAGGRRQARASSMRPNFGNLPAPWSARSNPRASTASRWLSMRLCAPTISRPPPWKVRFSPIWKTTAIKPIRRRTKSRSTLSPFVGGSQSAVDRGRILAEAQNFSRDLANEPANVLTPTLLAERARQMAVGIRPGMRDSGSGSHAPARHGRFAGRGARQRRASRAHRHPVQARQHSRYRRIISG